MRRWLKARAQEAEHDLLSKNAYVAVRWARGKGETETIVERAIERMKAKFPDANRDDIEEAVVAMNFNCEMESGGA